MHDDLTGSSPYEEFFSGTGRQTPIFHTIGRCYEAFDMLLRNDPDLTVKSRCAVAKDHRPDRPDGIPISSRVTEMTPLGYAFAVQQSGAVGHHHREVDPSREIERLRELSAPE